MEVRQFNLSIALIIAFSMSFISINDGFAAWPHDNYNGIGCFDCHDFNPYADFLSGGTSQLDFWNSYCTHCHMNESGGNYDSHNAPKVATHSSEITGNNRFGTWGFYCWNCHSNHYPNDTKPLITGHFSQVVQTATGELKLAVSDYIVHDPDYGSPSNWGKKSGLFRGLVLYLKDQRRMDASFEVLTANASVITLSEAAIPFSPSSQENSFAIYYGQLLKQAIGLCSDAPWQACYSDIDCVSGTCQEHSINSTSAETLASAPLGAMNDPSPNGICQVCHTRVNHWRSDGSLTNHNNGMRCTQCHEHKTGFLPTGCAGCHGFPPTLDYPDGQNGLVSVPSSTGAMTAGAHAIHADPSSGGYGFSCSYCHYGGMQRATDQNFRLEIDLIPFYQLGAPFGSAEGTEYHGTSIFGGSTPYDYGQLVQGTRIIKNGTMTCNNVYCHSKATLLAYNFQIAGQSPPWNSSGYDPQGDGQKCNNCHGYPPGHDAHYYHVSRGFTCKTCHCQTTQDNTTVNKTYHVNGRYDVVPAPEFITGGNSHPLDFTYSFAPGGGTCSNNKCHQFFSFTDPIRWKINYLEPAFSYDPGTCQQGATNATVTVSLSGFPWPEYPPYTCKIDWGDGTVENGIDCSSPISHVYQDNVFPIYDTSGNLIGGDTTGAMIGAWNITWTVWDNAGRILKGIKKTNYIEVCLPPNQAPVVQATFSAPGQKQLVVTDTSYDPDAIVGVHSGNGTITIDWGYGQTPSTYSADLSKSGPRTFTHTYGSRGYFWVRINVTDNSGAQTYGNWQRVWVD